MTRADKVRSMTDMEMARELYPLVAGTEVIPFCPGSERCGELLDKDGGVLDEWCIACLAAYLGRPAEETEGESKCRRRHSQNHLKPLYSFTDTGQKILPGLLP